MSHDIPESIPQGSDGAQEAENRRIEEIADEISRLCRVYEAQLRILLHNIISLTLLILFEVLPDLTVVPSCRYYTNHGWLMRNLPAR